jgi:mannose-6-phosphate isomerase
MSAAPRLLRFTPVYQERVWGGRSLETKLGRPLPPGKIIGESWEIVDRPEAQSLVAAGPWSGRTLRQIIAADPAFVMGPAWNAARPFPILVKWLDALARLSLQVHPPASLAQELGGEPKTENWYIAEAAPGAAILASVKPGVTRAQFERALHAHQLEPLVHRLPARRGDSFFMPSGRLHAIDAGCLILEIQQNSDTTYRVYDWGRKGLDGKPRALHIAESLQSIDFNDTEPAAIPASPTPATLVDCLEFRLRRVPLAAGAELKFPAHEQPRILSVVEGHLATDDPAHPQLERGANALVPFASSLALRALEPATLLVTENFTR